MEDMEFVDQCIIFVASKLPKLTRWRIYIAHHFVSVFGAIVSFGLPWICHEPATNTAKPVTGPGELRFWRKLILDSEGLRSNMKQHEATWSNESTPIIHHISSWCNNCKNCNNSSPSLGQCFGQCWALHQGDKTGNFGGQFNPAVPLDAMCCNEISHCEIYFN